MVRSDGARSTLSNAKTVSRGKLMMKVFTAAFFLTIVIVEAAAAAVPSEAAFYTFMGRIAERLIIVILAGCSLYFGYNLFRITTQQAGEMIASGKNWKFRMAQVGPGVFFALFGTVVLACALYQGPSWSETDPITQKISHLTGVFPNIDNGKPDTNAEILKGINSLILLRTRIKLLPNSHDETELSRIVEVLEPLRRDIVDALLGKGRYNEWAALNQRQTTDPANFERTMRTDTDLRQRYNKVEDLLSTRITEPQ
jgi:hypothetical protein